MALITQTGWKREAVQRPIQKENMELLWGVINKQTESRNTDCICMFETMLV